MTLDNIIEEIKKANSIAILTHESPDGDAIGSSLAMYLSLKQLGKNPDIIIPEISRVFNFLPKINEIEKEVTKESYDLVIVLDCADIKRLAGNEDEVFENADVTISIDHHGSNKMFADLNYINPVSPACAQILIPILETLGINIDKEIGTCLLTGIITDTGGFQYSGVTAETFEFAAKLLNKGVNVSDIYQKVLATKTKTNFELTKRIMDRMEFLENGKIAFTYMLKKDEDEIHTELGDHEGLVNIGRAIEGVEVSVFIRQDEFEKGFKVSLRSKDYINVSNVCMIFGGGGHPRAAGCYLEGTVEQIKSKIINQIKLYMK